MTPKERYLQKRKSVILENLKGLDDEAVIAINNYIAGYDGSLDYVENNDEEFFECFYADRIDELVRAISYGDYTYTDPYVRINAYGNLVTCYDPIGKGWIDLERIADWLVDRDVDDCDWKERQQLIKEYDLLDGEAA